MMKFIFMMFFMNFMLINNMMIMFYFNFYFFMSFMMIFMYMYKDLLWVSVSLMFGMEYYCYYLIVLSFWIISLMMMCLEKVEIIKCLMFINLVNILVLFFLSMNLLLLYLFFEISLIPIFFLIIYWGLSVERLESAYYMMLYMLLISFPLLMYIMYMYKYSLTLEFNLMLKFMEMYVFSFWEYMMIYLAFFIKMPIYIMHIWLPKAHVEAPVYGSMILAGVLLKMGSYGLIRLMVLFINMNMLYSYMIFSISIIGSVLMSLVCMVQIDMKKLVAYSSVVHMNLMLSSIMTMLKLGFLSSYIMMLGHGLCSSGLFYMVDLYYKRSNSRLMILNKGMMSKLPSLSMWWFLLCSSNFSFPFSLNFISEIMMLSLILNWDIMQLFYLFMISFMSSAYSLYLYSYVQYGFSGNNMMKLYTVEMKEFLVIFMHFYPLLMILLNLIMFM